MTDAGLSSGIDRYGCGCGSNPSNWRVRHREEHIRCLFGVVLGSIRFTGKTERASPLNR